MARAYKRTCIVLKRTKLKETDAILTMLSDDESRQVRAVAKGVRRPGSRYGARLEPFSVVEAQLHPGRSLETLGEVRCLETNAACREDLVRTAACDCMAELLEKAGRDGAGGDARIFSLTRVALAAIGEADPAAAPVLACAHMLKACAMLGFTPSLHACASCGRPLPSPTRYGISAGGAICGECAALVGGGDAIDSRVWQAVDFLLHTSFADMCCILKPAGAAVSSDDARGGIGDVGKTAAARDSKAGGATAVSGVPFARLLDFTQRWCREHLSLNLRCVDFLRSLPAD